MSETTSTFNRPAIYIGVPEDRRREQFTADIMLHRAGTPGHVYVAQVLARVRANSLNELQALVADYAWDYIGALRCVLMAESAPPA